MAKAEENVSNGAKVREARVTGIHWGGARVVSLLTTDQTKIAVSGAGVVVAESMTLHPAGLLVRADGATKIIPYARVEVLELGDN